MKKHAKKKRYRQICRSPVEWKRRQNLARGARSAHNPKRENLFEERRRGEKVKTSEHR
jgi:hypothetical protein